MCRPKRAEIRNLLASEKGKLSENGRYMETLELGGLKFNWFLIIRVVKEILGEKSETLEKT